MVSYEIKNLIAGIGFLMLISGGAMSIISCTSLGEMPCVTDEQKLVKGIGINLMLPGFIMLLIGFLLPGNKLEDYYSHTPLGSKIDPNTEIKNSLM